MRSTGTFWMLVGAVVIGCAGMKSPTGGLLFLAGAVIAVSTEIVDAIEEKK